MKQFKLYWRETLALLDLSTVARAALFVVWILCYKSFERTVNPHLYAVYFWMMHAWFVVAMFVYDFAEKQVKRYGKTLLRRTRTA
jgi:predicted membrane-bound dolichyl-phosphate-mannose-protein mannosyltransferase